VAERIQLGLSLRQLARMLFAPLPFQHIDFFGMVAVRLIKERLPLALPILRLAQQRLLLGLKGVAFATDGIGFLSGQAQLLITSGNFLPVPALGLFQLQLVLLDFLLVLRRLLFDASSLVLQFSVLFLCFFLASHGLIEGAADLGQFFPMLLDLSCMPTVFAYQIVPLLP
jgi:hypothetical protein